MELQRTQPRAFTKMVLSAVLFSIAAALLVNGLLGSGIGTSDAAKIHQQERELENLIPKHVPLGIKIRKEKEKEFKDLNNERWARDFELEVTNTGDKPIYAFYLLMFLDVRAAAGYQIIAPIYYGRDELDNLKGRPTLDDVPIKPGESIICKIHPSQFPWWERARRDEHRPHPKKVQIKLQFLSFGDGTGLMGNEGIALPRKIPNQSRVNRSRSSPSAGPKVSTWFENRAPKGAERIRSSNLPASFLPVSFWLSDFVLRRLPTNVEPLDECYPDGCTSLIYYQRVTCNECPPQDDPSITYCGDPLGACFSSSESHFIECGTNGCGVIELTSCEAPTPTPTPDPSPSPTCNPATNPTSKIASARQTDKEVLSGPVAAVMGANSPITMCTPGTTVARRIKVMMDLIVVSVQTKPLVGRVVIGIHIFADVSTR